MQGVCWEGVESAGLCVWKGGESAGCVRRVVVSVCREGNGECVLGRRGVEEDGTVY